MLQPKRHLSANDNAQLRQPRIRETYADFVGVSSGKPANPIKVYKIKSTAAWLMPLFSVMLAVYAIWQGLSLSTLFWPSVIIMGLLLLTAARSERDSRLRNVSGLLMVAAATTALAALLAQNGFTLIGLELVLLVSTLALISGWVFKSAPLVLLSAFSSLLYLASSYPELGLTTGLTDQKSQLGAGLIPFIILGQIALAQKLKSALVLSTGVLAGYIWFGTLASDMPLPALAGLGFAVAAAHYWLSKAWTEAAKFGADIHRFFAWIIALCAALYIQSVWLSAGNGQPKPFWPPDSFWWAVMGSAMFLLFIVSLMRYKTSHITLLGIFIVCLAVATLPVAMAKPDLVYTLFDVVPGLNARPGLGLIIGATVIAGGFFWLVDGLKNGRILDMTIGALAIGIQAMILFQATRFDADLGVIFIVSLICALCIGGLVAGASPDRSHSPNNYA